VWELTEEHRLPAVSCFAVQALLSNPPQAEALQSAPTGLALPVVLRAWFARAHLRRRIPTTKQRSKRQGNPIAMD
jgi:hypothetical protein